MSEPSNEEAKPGAGTSIAGIFSLFAYLIGSVVLAFVVVRLVTDEDFLLVERWRGPCFAFGSIIMGVALQAIREGREGRERGQAQAEEQAEVAFDPRGALLFLLGPLAASWIQFELFWDNIWMFPLPMLFGGVWLGAELGAFAGHRLGLDRFRSTVIMVTIAVFTFPLTLVSLALPISHFRKHGSSVEFPIAEDGYDAEEVRLDYELPRPPTREISPIGSGTMELVSALAEAETIEVTMIDGVAHKTNEAGELVPIEETSIDELFAEAEAQDARDLEEQQRKYEQELAAYEEEVMRLRRGGRIFSGW